MAVVKSIFFIGGIFMNGLSLVGGSYLVDNKLSKEQNLRKRILFEAETPLLNSVYERINAEIDIEALAETCGIFVSNAVEALLTDLAQNEFLTLYLTL